MAHAGRTPNVNAISVPAFGGSNGNADYNDPLVSCKGIGKRGAATMGAAF